MILKLLLVAYVLSIAACQRYEAHSHLRRMKTIALACIIAIHLVITLPAYTTLKPTPRLRPEAPVPAQHHFRKLPPELRR